MIFLISSLVSLITTLGVAEPSPDFRPTITGVSTDCGRGLGDNVNGSKHSIYVNMQQQMNSDSQFYDFFPLSLRLMYEYDYYMKYTEDWVGLIESEAVDSGIVKYLVHDSVQVDSTIIWTVEQWDSLWHRRYSRYGKDTSYWTVDSTVGKLYEHISGKHQLIDSLISDYPVWSFPLRKPGQTIYRYSADTARIILARTYNDSLSPCYSFDTIRFSHNIGLYLRSTHSFCPWGNTHSQVHKLIRLRNGPVTSAHFDSPRSVDFALSQNYPNPFNPSTEIRFTISIAGFTTLVVYDLLGSEITALVNEFKHPGEYTVVWNASNLSSGVYYYQLKVGNYIEVKKLVLMR